MPVEHTEWKNQEEVDRVPELSDEEKDALAQKMRAMDKLLADSGKAKYKIELMFVRARSTWKPTRGIITFWESGTKLHGGGDTSMKICPGKRLGKNDCVAFISDTTIGLGHCVCPECGTVWKGEQVIDAHIGNYTMRDWADILYKYFRLLGHNCDIYLKHSPDDIRSAAFQETQGKTSDALTGTRRRRALHIYPLANIIKDTSAGSDILTRIYAFLTA